MYTLLGLNNYEFTACVISTIRQASFPPPPTEFILKSAIDILPFKP